jgi:hypothetical protein
MKPAKPITVKKDQEDDGSLNIAELVKQNNG